MSLFAGFYLLFKSLLQKYETAVPVQEFFIVWHWNAHILNYFVVNSYLIVKDDKTLESYGLNAGTSSKHELKT